MPLGSQTFQTIRTRPRARAGVGAALAADLRAGAAAYPIASLERQRAIAAGMLNVLATIDTPALRRIAEGAFDNVLCETVIMHLPPGQIGAAVQRLVSLLRPGGTLYLSWRVTPDADQRDGRGRLFTSFDAAPVREALAGTEVVFDEAAVSQSSGRTIHRIVARTV